MADSAAVRGLVGDIERISERAAAAARDLERSRREARAAEARAERAEQALGLLQEEREVIREALRRVARGGDAGTPGTGAGDEAGREKP